MQERVAPLKKTGVIPFCAAKLTKKSFPNTIYKILLSKNHDVFNKHICKQ